MAGDPVRNEGCATPAGEGHPFDGFTADERRELGEALGQVVAYFAESTKIARSQRDHWKFRAERAEALVERYRHDGVRVTDQAVERV